jgi:Tol biopolymer transport system component
MGRHVFLGRPPWLWLLAASIVLLGAGVGAFLGLRRAEPQRTAPPPPAAPTSPQELLQLLAEANWRRHLDDPQGAFRSEAAGRAAAPEVLEAALAEARKSPDWWMQAAGVELEGQTRGFPLPSGWAQRVTVWPPDGGGGEWPELIDVDTGQTLHFAPPLESLRVASAAWSPHFDRLALIAVTPRSATLWIADLIQSRLFCLPVLLESPRPFEPNPARRERYAAWPPPVWSPDGQSLAVATGSGPDVWTLFLDAATGRVQRWMPAFTVSGWSADGRRLWLANRLGQIDLHTGRLTFFENASAPPGAAFGQAWWSPTGRYLLRQVPSEAGAPQIEWIDWQTARRQRLASRSTAPPAWSCDGTRFLICGSATATGRVQLLIYDADAQLLGEASGETPIAAEDWFRWTRDGRLVRGHGNDVQVVWPPASRRQVGTLVRTPTPWPPPWLEPVDRPSPREVGAAVAQLPPRAVDWPREGELIAFFSDRAGGATLWLARRDGSLLNTGLPARWITAAALGYPLALARQALCLTLAIPSSRAPAPPLFPGTDRQGWLFDLAHPAVHLLDSCWQAVWSPDGQGLLTARPTFQQTWTSQLLHWNRSAEGPPTAARLPGQPVGFLPLRWRADGWILGSDLQGRVPLALRADGRAAPYRGTLPPAADQLCDWSPDGSLVAYLDAAGTLYVAYLDSQGRSLQVAQTPCGGCAQARFSPDGHLVAFTSTEPTGIPALYLMSLSPPRVQRLTTDEIWQMDSALYHAEPAWTSDGGLLFIRRPLRAGQGQGDILWLNPARTQIFNLTQAPANYWGLSCSP